MLSPYAEVLRTRGGLRFSSAGLVARLPIAMTSLGLVLLVSARTGSYGLGGVVSAVYVLVGSVLAPLQARVSDRIGQAAVVWPLLAGQLVGYGLVLGLARPGQEPSVPGLVAAAALIGATQPQVGSMVRARWAAVHSGTALLHPAYALESVIDEIVFTVGPVLVTTLAAATDPSWAITVSLLLAVGGGAVFAAQRSTEPVPHGRTTGPRPPVPVGELLGLVLSFAAVGALFGGLDVAVVAAAAEAGAPGAAGAVLASFSLASLVAGLAFGAWTWRAPIRTRMLLTQLALAVALVPLPFAPSLPALAGIALVAGLAISPVLVTGFSLVERLVPAARLTEGLSWTSTALGAGIAAGGATAGAVADRAGASTAFWVPVISAAVAVVPAAVARARRSPDAVVEPVRVDQAVGGVS